MEQNNVDPKQKKNMTENYVAKNATITKEILVDIINIFLTIINLNTKDFIIETQVEIKLMCTRKDIRLKDLSQTVNNIIN